MNGYKIRLPDGSEIGPMDLEGVKGWYAKGFVGRDDLVLKPGGSRWVPLRTVLQSDKASKPGSASGPSPELLAAVRAASRPRAARGRALAPDTPSAPVEVHPWRTIAAGALLLLGATVGGFFLFFGERWIQTLDAAPWRELALAQLALGLLLIRGWELGRKLARGVVLLALAALFPVAGILVAQGVRGAGLLVLASALVLGLGQIALLGPGRISTLQSALRLALVAAGWAGILRFGLVPENPERARIRAAAASARSFEDAANGLSFVVPDGWVELRADQSLVPMPPGTRLVLAQPQRAGFGVLRAEATADARPSLDEYLSHALEARALPSRTERARSDVTLGGLAGRQVASTWVREGQPQRDLLVVARDGRTFVSLAAFIPDDGSARPEAELAALVRGLSLKGLANRRADEALQAAVRDLPQLSTAAIEAVIARGASVAPEAHEVFRRSQEMLGRGAAALAPEEGRELGVLLAALQAPLPRKERTTFAGYLQRVRDGGATTAEEDRSACALMKAQVLRLPADAQQRLRALNDRAIRGAG